MSLIAELQRRKVFKVGAAYLVVAWLAVQAASIGFPAFDAPPWALRIFILIALLGFPVALVMAWIFDVTPEGMKLDASKSGSKRVFAATGLLVVLALGWYFYGQPAFRRGDGISPAATPAAIEASQSSPTATPTKSIAVLPFLNMSSDPKQDYFSDGMTEEILNALANVPNLEVTARTSVFALKGQSQDVREIGKRLGVAYLLEGSVRQAGDEVRVTAQLIRTDNGFHLWSQDYDRKLTNVFALQADVAGDIAQALKLPLGIGGDAALVSQRTDDPRAYALYLQARAAYRERGDGVTRSIDLYHAALARDPKFAPAWAGLCGSLNVLPFYLPENRTAEIPQTQRDAESACKNAIELAPDLASPHIMLANLYTNEWRWVEADEHFQRAQALAPNDPEFYFAYTDWLGAQGRVEEALQAAQRAVALDSMAPMYRNLYGYLLNYSGRFDECVAQMEAGYALAPKVVYLVNNLSTCYVLTGRIDDAEKLRDSLRNALTASGESPAVIARKLAIHDAVIAAARKPDAYAELRKPLGTDGLVMARIFPSHIDDLFLYVSDQIDKHASGSDPVVLLRSPLFAKYHDDPRYLRLLKKVGFDASGKPL